MAYKRVVKLIMVTEENNNKFYDMYDLGDGTFRAEYGRVDLTKSEITYPISKWDSTIRSKTKKGYRDISSLSVVVVNEDSKPVDIGDNKVKSFFNELNRFSKESLASNYNVSSTAVTESMVAEAQRILEELHRNAVLNADKNLMNKKLLDLFHVIPRKMRHVSEHLFSEFSGQYGLENNLKLIAHEQDTLDVLANDVKTMAAQKASDAGGSPAETKKDILTVLGLTIVPCTPNETDMLKKMMGGNVRQFVEAYKVINGKTQGRFDLNLKQASNKYVDVMFHGSRNENWLNIMNTGLLIRPTTAVHTGSMFGDGIYAANKADKSIGYCSLHSSRWTHGGSNVGLLGVFKFHLGKQYKVDSSDSSLSRSKLKRLGDYDSTYAKAGRSLRNDEFIVYDINQATIQYLIKING